VTVTDNGIGFDPAYADRVFEMFQRLHGRGEYEGTGIGLAICRKIVQRHGGRIIARGRPGEGATFIIDLPAKVGSAS
jgi:signal transduction histidine kinase